MKSHFRLTGSKTVAGQGREAKMFPWFEDQDRAAVQASGLTSNMQLQQANAFILKVFERHVLLPQPTNDKKNLFLLKKPGNMTFKLKVWISFSFMLIWCHC